MKNLSLGLVLSSLVFISCNGTNNEEENTNGAVACFELEASSIEVDTEISFSNCSENASSYKWDFGDGSTSKDENPTHLYEGVGEYMVTLVVSDENGSDSISKNVTVVRTKNYVEYKDSIYALSQAYFYKNPEENRDILIITSKNFTASDSGNVNGEGELLIFQLEEKGLPGNHILEVDNKMNGLGISQGMENEFVVRFKQGNVNVTESESVFTIDFDGSLSDTTETRGNYTGTVRVFDRTDW